MQEWTRDLSFTWTHYCHNRLAHVEWRCSDIGTVVAPASFSASTMRSTTRMFSQNGCLSGSATRRGTHDHPKGSVEQPIGGTDRPQRPETGGLGEQRLHGDQRQRRNTQMPPPNRLKLGLCKTNMFFSGSVRATKAERRATLVESLGLSRERTDVTTQARLSSGRSHSGRYSNRSTKTSM